MPQCPLPEEIIRVVFHTDFSGEGLNVIHHVIAANCDDCREKIRKVVYARLEQTKESQHQCKAYQEKVFDHCKKIMELSGQSLENPFAEVDKTNKAQLPKS